MCLCICACLTFGRPSLPVFTTHPWNEKRNAQLLGIPNEMCCLRLGQGLLELLRALTGQTESASQLGTGLVIHGETTKTSPYRKNMRIIRSIIQWNYVEIRNHIFLPEICHMNLFLWVSSKKQQKNTKSWPPGHERCEEQESHFHRPIFGCLGPTCR